MKVFHTVADIREALCGAAEVKGFVPTMGALHKGHLSLVEKAKNESDAVVVSIFVNPTQFNDPSDLKNYPRDIEADLKMLEKAGADFVFVPDVEEIYPEPDNRIFDFGNLDKVMEGAHRPGHFNGVAQVVSRLFAIINPDKAFFGEKDFQQLAIVRAMVGGSDGFERVEITGCPIVREHDGLAMSSRNVLLTAEQRAATPEIYKAISRAAESRKDGKAVECSSVGVQKCTEKLDNAGECCGTGNEGKNSLENFKKKVIDEINENPLLEVEYFDVVDAETLESIASWDNPATKRGCVAVRVGNVRLIDNIEIE